MKHGGKRPGAGRKSLPEDKRRAPLAVRIDPEILAYLAEMPSKTATIEKAILESPGFREWQKSRST